MKTLKISNEISMKDLVILVLLAVFWFALYHHICWDKHDNMEKLDKIIIYMETMSGSLSDTNIWLENIAKELNCDLYDECGQFNNN